MMIELCRVKLPLFVHTTKSKTKKGKIIFNLNNYRNAFHNKNNAAKKAMKKYITDTIKCGDLGEGPFHLQYEYFHGNARKIDVANPCSVIDKFTCDAITELGLWPDDNIEHVKSVSYLWGGIDPNKEGYCNLIIYQV